VGRKFEPGDDRAVFRLVIRGLADGLLPLEEDAIAVVAQDEADRRRTRVAPGAAIRV